MTAFLHTWAHALRNHKAQTFNALCLLIFIASAACAVQQALTHPFRNWDMAPYIGAAAGLSGLDDAARYKLMLEEVKRVASPEMYYDVSEKSVLSNKQDAFMEQMPWYNVKPLYVGLVWALEKTHLVGYAEATWVVSALAFGVLCLLLALWWPRQMNYGAWLLALVAFTWTGIWPLRVLAHYSTPDALALALLVAAWLMLMKRRSSLGFAAFGVLTLMARPDLLIMLALLLALFTLLPEAPARIGRRMGLGIAALFALVYCAIQIGAGAYGWRMLIYYGFIERIPYPATTPITLTVGQYLGILWGGITNLTYDIRFLPMLGLSLLAAFCHFMRPRAGRVWPWLLAAAWAGFAARFVLFPNWFEYRFNYPYYVLMLVAMAEMIPPYLLALWARLLEHRREINP